LCSAIPIPEIWGEVPEKFLNQLIFQERTDTNDHESDDACRICFGQFVQIVTYVFCLKSNSDFQGKSLLKKLMK